MSAHFRFPLSAFRFGRHVEYVAASPIPPAELPGAFAVPADQKQWRATMQVIDELAADAQKAALETVANHATCASFLGHVEFAQLLKKRLIGLREQSMGGRPQS
jgi:hypothetical protein